MENPEFTLVAEEMHVGAHEVAERDAVIAEANKPPVRDMSWGLARQARRYRAGRYVSDGCGCVERVNDW